MPQGILQRLLALLLGGSVATDVGYWPGSGAAAGWVRGFGVAGVRYPRDVLWVMLLGVLAGVHLVVRPC